MRRLMFVNVGKLNLSKKDKIFFLIILPLVAIISYLINYKL